LDASDRTLFLQAALNEEASRATRLAWIAVTQLGSTAVTVGLAVLGLFLPGLALVVGSRALAALVVSHLAIQVVKRLVGRPRPTVQLGCHATIAEPDRFSFPSGHATASLAVALAYAVAFPALTFPLVAVALLCGWSRVVLGVHYPGDVLVGQVIALLTVLATG
jgi:undecaprenyl-diphosphatase